MAQSSGGLEMIRGESVSRRREEGSPCPALLGGRVR